MCKLQQTYHSKVPNSQVCVNYNRRTTVVPNPVVQTVTEKQLTIMCKIQQTYHSSPQSQVCVKQYNRRNSSSPQSQVCVKYNRRTTVLPNPVVHTVTEKQLTSMCKIQQTYHSSPQSQVCVKQYNRRTTVVPNHRYV